MAKKAIPPVPLRPGAVRVLDPKTAQRITLKLAIEGEGFAGQFTQKLRQWAAAGLSEDAIMAKVAAEFAPGGATWDSLMKQFGNATGQAVDFVTLEEAHADWKGENRWIWLTVSDTNRCEDCKERQAVVHTWEEWEELGLPGAGATVCGWRCRCTLEPLPYGQGIDLRDFLGGQE